MASICSITHLTLASFMRNQIPCSTFSNANKGKFKKCAQVDCEVYVCAHIHKTTHARIHHTCHKRT